MNTDLFQAYKDRRLVLFVGAGVSMNLGMPSWNQLVEKMACDLDYQYEIFRNLGDHYTLAEYYRLEKKGIGQLLRWMKEEGKTSSRNVAQSKVHELIAKLDVDLIYTTNYDRLIEAAFEHRGRDVARIARVADLASAVPGVTQVVKLHGDIEDESSIVLDESSYFERLEFESPLDIKLRADTLGKSVLFVGYSLKDINIRLLFYKLSRLWKNDPEGRPASFVLATRPNPVQEATLRQWNIQVICPDTENHGEELANLLQALVDIRSV